MTMTAKLRRRPAARANDLTALLNDCERLAEASKDVIDWLDEAGLGFVGAELRLALERLGG